MDPPEPHRPDRHRDQPARRENSHRNLDPWLSPWPAPMPWWIMVAGVVLGRWVGYTPHLFVAMAAACLLLGWLGDGGVES